MLLRHKVNFIIAAGLVVMLVSVYVAAHLILLNSYTDLEQQDARKNVQRVVDTLAEDLTALNNQLADWAAWDESYAFIESADPEFVKRNLPQDTYSTLKLNLLMFINTSGNPVFSKGFDLLAKEYAAVPKELDQHLTPGARLLRHSDTDNGVTGILMLPAGPMLVASRPILTTERKGPLRGTMIMGRYLDNKGLERLSALTHLPVKIYPVNTAKLPPADVLAVRDELLKTGAVTVRQISNQTLGGYALLKDVNDRPALFMQILGARPIYLQGKTTITYFIICLLIVGIILGAVIKMIWNRLQISQARRRESEEQARYLAQYDTLTGLPNRLSLENRLRQSIARAQRAKRQVAVLLVDLDRFKLINDALGHPIGDSLLQFVAGRLKACIREGETLSRQSGDEFVILLPDLTRTEDAAYVAQRILEALAQPFEISGHALSVAASIGISLYPNDGDESDILLKNADLAMYHVKHQGGNNYHFYTIELNAKTSKHMMLENNLRLALQRDEFFLVYQPMVELETGAVCGMETLLRWQHPELGLVSPADFIPIAEQTGLIVALGEWVLETACRQAKLWQQQGHKPLRLAVNLSARQFRQNDLAYVIAQILQNTGLSAQWLELELTESLLLDHVDDTIATMQQLTELGLALSIDDFGTGYSALAYLKRIPLTTLKIDRMFVKEIVTSSGDAAITSALIELAHKLGIKVVAEGVENEAQLNTLIRQRCDIMQGYYFSPPLSVEAFGQLLQAGRCLAPGAILVC